MILNTVLEITKRLNTGGYILVSKVVSAQNSIDEQRNVKQPPLLSGLVIQMTVFKNHLIPCHY